MINKDVDKQKNIFIKQKIKKPIKSNLSRSNIFFSHTEILESLLQSKKIWKSYSHFTMKLKEINQLINIKKEKGVENREAVLDNSSLLKTKYAAKNICGFINLT